MTKAVPSDASAQPEHPIRTCVGCRTRDERQNLLRIASVQPASEEAGTPRYLPDTAGTKRAWSLLRRRTAWPAPSRGRYLPPR